MPSWGHDGATFNPYSHPERHDAQRHRQTDRQTDRPYDANTVDQYGPQIQGLQRRNSRENPGRLTLR